MQTISRTFFCSLAFLLLVIPLASHAQSALQFVPIQPCRIVDTRNTGNPIIGGIPQNFAIQGDQGACTGIPPSAAAYSLNVAVVPRGELGYLTVWPAGQNQPYVATLNSVDGRIKSVAAVVGAGSADGGAVSVYATDTTDLVLDLDGYFTTPNPGVPTLAFYPITPCRVLDTRGGQYLVGGQTYTYPVSGVAPCNVPNLPPGAGGYSLNFTAIPHQPLGYLTAWPTGQPQPLAATLNAVTGTYTGNASLIEAGDGGQLNVYASNDTDLVIDANGYFAPPGFAPAGLSLFTETPCRVLDTRLANGLFSGTLPVEMVVSPCALPSVAQAVVVNATVVPQGPLGYLTLWANGQLQPFVATLNAFDGVVTNNLAVVPTSNGYINAFATSPTQLIVDLFDYFAIPSGLNGNYTFTINGYNSGGLVLMAGSFVATPDTPFDGNGTVSGALDLNSASGTPQPGNRFFGTYSIQPNGLGTMSITLPAPLGTFDFSVAVSSTGNGRLILNNDSNQQIWGTGAINVQNPADLSMQQIGGSFASGYSGVDPTLHRYAGAGLYLINQTGGVSGSSDTNDNGTLQMPLTSGLLNSLDPGTGRGTATLIISAITTHWVFYVTSANELTFLSIDPINSPANLVLQTMLRQATLPFDDTYLNGASVVRTSGLSQTDKRKKRLQGGGMSDVVLGLFMADGKGNGSVSLDENNGGTLTQQQMSKGTYTFDPSGNGRVTLTGFGYATPPILYVVDKNEAFVLGQDNSVASGFLVPQSGAPFSNASGIGAYWGGNYMPVTSAVMDSVVTAFADGNGNLNGTFNATGSGGTLPPQNFMGTYSVDGTGRMTLMEGGNLAAILYVISPTRVAMLSATDSNPSVAVLGSTN
ncbi:MAG: hypothetical protein ACLPND_06715 [Candidatus Korobacteraceae bacterium]|jgi:hypothetical protein